MAVDAVGFVDVPGDGSAVDHYAFALSHRIKGQDAETVAGGFGAKGGVGAVCLAIIGMAAQEEQRRRLAL
jgi:hypothetical protein